MIQRGGSVCFEMPEEFAGQWFSAALVPQSTERNLDSRVVNFQAQASGDKVVIADLTPGDYWLAVANDQRVAECFARKGAFRPSVYGTNLISGYFSRSAATGIASVTVIADQITVVEKVMPETLVTLCGVLPTRSGLSAAETGVEWLNFENEGEANIYTIMRGGLRAVPAGKSAGRLPDLNLPVYIGG
ncbi:MAG: hypothetical protein ACD_39C00752G0001, partial [uncultured bacterium]